MARLQFAGATGILATALVLILGVTQYYSTSNPERRLKEALRVAGTPPVRYPGEEHKITFPDAGYTNPIPSIVPHTHRVLSALGASQARTSQAYEHLPDLTYQDVAETITRSLKSSFGQEILDSRKLSDASDDSSILTWANTEPLSIVVNWANFDINTAKPYSTCFSAGSWSFIGSNNPGDPPASSSDTTTAYPICDFTNYDVFTSDVSSCWYQCQASDVTNTERFNFLKANVDTAVANINQMYRIPKLSSPLKFQWGSMANFANNALGYQDLTNVCSPSTFAYCETFLPASYCDSGVAGGNAVLNMVYKPYMWGGGLGGTCEYDQHGRPISLGFWAHLSLKDTITNLDAAGKTSAQKNSYLVGFATHEVNHGLGFNLGAFLDAGIVEKKPVYSGVGGTGTKEDDLWHFKKDTRLAKLAQVHFDCWDDDAWDGVPLMGAIEGGRDSHQNSFLFLEDVESYGTFEMNTPFTLAALEDTGHYLANYTYSQYPNWGAYQGCDFITTRCRTRGGTSLNNAYSIVSDDSECDRNFATSGDSKYSKCAAPDCGSKNKCHPECVVLTSDNAEEYTNLRPVMNGTDALLGSPKASGLLDKFNDFLNSELFQLVLPIVIWLVTWIVLFICRKLCCDSEASMIRFSHFVSGVFLVCGLALIALAGYMYYYRSVFEGVFTLAGIAGVAAFGFVIASQSVMQWLSATGTNRVVFKCTAFLSCTLLVLQFFVLAWIVLYNYALDSVQQNSSGGDKWDGHFLGMFMRPVESYLCESYRNCCWDPTLPEDGVCTTAHEGAVGAAIDDGSDPSRPSFCEYISGVASSSLSVGRGISPAGCAALDGVIQGFDRNECQAEFCASSTSGYEDFVTLAVASFRRNFNVIAGIFFILVIIQLEQMRVLRSLYDFHAYQEDEDKKLVERGRRESARMEQRENALRAREEADIREATKRSMEMTQV